MLNARKKQSNGAENGRRKEIPTDKKNRHKPKSLIRRRKRSRRHLAIQIGILIGCLWLAIILGFWAYSMRNPSGSPLTISTGLQQAASHSIGVRGVVQRAKKRNVSFLKNNLSLMGKEAKGTPTNVIEKRISNLLPLSDDANAYLSPVLIFTCHRENYLRQTLDDLLINIGDHCGFGCPIIVSEDGSHPQIREVVENFSALLKARGVPLIHLQHQQADLAAKNLRRNPTLGYQALAKHYGWALTQVFNGLDESLPLPQRVIILEEDLHTSPDFLSYMKATSKILDKDEKLLAVSAYNDNGHMANDAYRVLRSDFFPGLGWMMTRRLWKDELESKWPNGYWDDWLREPVQRKGRHILRPEFSRTFHFGEKGGTSQNQFGSILSRVKLNTQSVDWETEDLSYLTEERFDEMYAEMVRHSKLVETVAEALEKVEVQDTHLIYDNLTHFKLLAEELDIMDDEKATIPRTAYKGIIEIRPLGKNIIFLTPPMAELKKAIPLAFQ